MKPKRKKTKVRHFVSTITITFNGKKPRKWTHEGPFMTTIEIPASKETLRQRVKRELDAIRKSKRTKTTPTP